MGPQCGKSVTKVKINTNGGKVAGAKYVQVYKQT